MERQVEKIWSEKLKNTGREKKHGENEKREYEERREGMEKREKNYR